MTVIKPLFVVDSRLKSNIFVVGNGIGSIIESVSYFGGKFSMKVCEWTWQLLEVYITFMCL